MGKHWLKCCNLIGHSVASKSPCVKEVCKILCRTSFHLEGQFWGRGNRITDAAYLPWWPMRTRCCCSHSNTLRGCLLTKHGICTPNVPVRTPNRVFAIGMCLFAGVCRTNASTVYNFNEMRKWSSWSSLRSLHASVVWSVPSAQGVQLQVSAWVTVLQRQSY